VNYENIDCEFYTEENFISRIPGKMPEVSSTNCKVNVCRIYSALIVNAWICNNQLTICMNLCGYVKATETVCYVRAVHQMNPVTFYTWRDWSYQLYNSVYACPCFRWGRTDHVSGCPSVHLCPSQSFSDHRFLVYLLV